MTRAVRSVVALARRWREGRAVACRLLLTLLAALHAPTAYAASQACNDVNAFWSAGRTSPSSPGAGYDGIYANGFAPGETLSYSAETFNSSSAEKNGLVANPAIFQIYTDFTTDVEIKPGGGAEGVGSGTLTPVANRDYYISFMTGAVGQVRATVRCNTGAQAPVAASSTATFAANSTANAVPLSLSGGAATSVAVAIQASHGTATASGTGIRYTPSAGFSGADSFRYTATNASGTSAPATVSITVTAPTLAITPASGALPGSTVGAAYSQTFGASGGTAPYAFAATGALPPGLTLSAGGSLSGTPTMAGSFNFTINATDAQGATGSASYGITVVGQAPVAGATSATVAANSTGNAVTLALSGGAATSVAIASQAGHGTATASGTGISYTPTSGFAGSDSFTYTASNGSGTSAPATATITVTAPTLVLTPATLPAATAGAAYSQTLAGSGGTAPYSYVVTAGTLPAGLTLSGGGALSGTPTAPGAYNLTLTATDAQGFTASRSYTMVVSAQAPVAGGVSTTVAANSSGNAVALALSGGSATSVAVARQASHGTATATGTSISYTPVAGFAGSDSFTYTASNASGTSSPATVTVTVIAPTLVLTPTALPGAAAGTAYTRTLTASGGAAPYSYAVTSGVLPVGLTLSPGGALSGTPTAAGTFNFVVTATDAGDFTVSRSYGITVAAPTVVLVPPVLPAATAGTAYSQTLASTGGIAPYSYAVTAGALPNGLTLSSGGTLSGTPTTAGTFNLTVTATDAGSFAGSRTYSITVAAPTVAVSPTTLPAGAAGAAYSQTLSGTGGTAPYSYAVTAGALPTGLTLSSGGTLSGTPTKAGTFNLTVTVTDAGNFTGSRGYAITIAAPTVVLTPATLPAAAVGAAYSQTLSSTGGSAPYSYAVTAGALPTGLALASGGTLSGTPTTPGSFNLTVTATDAQGFTASRSYTIVVAAQAPIAGAVNTSVAANSGANTVALALSGGAATAISVVTPPSHGALTGSGTSISYTPSAGFSGTDSFTYEASNAAGISPPATVTITVTAPSLAISPAAGPLPAGKVGEAYTRALTASGGVSPYSYTATGLPAGVTLSDGGTLAGTPTTPGDYAIAVTITDANGVTGTAGYTLLVAVQAPIAGTVSKTVSANSDGNAVTLALSGGAASSVAVASGPSHGAAIVSGTAISYSPVAGYSGGDSFTYTATNASGTSSPAVVTITVTAPTLQLSPASLPAATVGTPYSQTLGGSGGTAPYSYALTAGALPAGLTLSSGGTLSGTPTTSGTFDLTVTATDAHGFTASRSYSVTVAVQAPVAGAVGITVAANSTDNAVRLDLSGAAATSVAVVTAPAHGTATVTGIGIGYTPAAGFAGTDSFTYTASNASGSSAAATVAITVTAPSLAISPAAGPLPAATVGAAYTQALTAAGGAAPYSYTATGLPAGVTLSNGGTLSGTPTTAGVYTVTVGITDANGFGGTASYSLTVSAPPPPVAADPATTSVSANTETEAGQSVSLNLTSLVTGRFDEIRIVTQPTHGTVTISRTLAMRGIGGSPFMAAALAMSAVPVPSQVVAVYTPEPGYQGTDTFQYVAVGPGGTSAPATATIQVVGKAPTAQGITATATDGQPVSIDLTAGASGGPFTAAAITEVSPADQVIATILAGGTADARTFRLQVTPKAHYDGVIEIGYTLTNAFGTSTPAKVTVSVTARPDPSRDATVRAMSDAQAEAARRFARAQVANFMGHAETLHGADCARSSNGLRLGSTDRPYERREPGQPIDGVKSDRGGRSSRDAETPARGGASTGCGGKIAVWTGGIVDIGTRDAITDRAKVTATTSGVSAGIDLHAAKGLTIGIGGGLGRDRSSIEGGAADVSGSSRVVAAYASVVPAHGVFVDGVLARGWLDYSLSRLDAGAGAQATADRSGTFTTGALSSGVDRVSGALRWSLYGRAEYMAGRLDRYVEEGAGIYDLRFDARDLRSVTGALGLRLGWQRPVSFGLLTGRLRTEWLHEFTGGTRQRLDYADVEGPSYYGLLASGWSREQFVFAPGIGLALPSGWDVGLDVGIRVADGERAATTGVQVRKGF